MYAMFIDYCNNLYIVLLSVKFKNKESVKIFHSCIASWRVKITSLGCQVFSNLNVSLILFIFFFIFKNTIDLASTY
jgi:hypothetical protein